MAQIDFLGDPIFQAIDGSGAPIQGGLLWCYDAGTDNLRDMYATINDAVNSTNPIANPATLNSSGSASIVYAGASKFILESADIDPDTGHGALIWTADNIGRFGNTVIDPNGNIIVDYDYVEDAANYIEIVNAAAGSNPKIQGQGVDPHVGVIIRVKGTTDGVTIKSDTSEYTLPPIDGPSGYVLMTNGSGAVSWQPPPGVSQVIPPGAVMDFAMSLPPTGWLTADGAAVSRATYAGLFAAIGTAFGAGDGVNTFNTPDMRRRVRMGFGGTGTATIGNTVASTGGTETVTLTSAQIPAHTHAASANTVGDHQHSVGANATIAAAGAGVNGVTGTGVTGAAGSHTHTITVSNNTGGGGSHNNIQPSIVMLACIKT